MTPRLAATPQGRQPHRRYVTTVVSAAVGDGLADVSQVHDARLVTRDTATPVPSSRRRDRRGRGIRGPVIPASLPGHRTRTEDFDDIVLAAVADVERAWERQMAGTEFAVEDVPPSDPSPWESGRVPLGRAYPAESGQPARVVVYRRPIEFRATDPADLADLIHDVVVEHIAHLIGRTPEEIDPHFGGDD